MRWPWRRRHHDDRSESAMATSRKQNDAARQQGQEAKQISDGLRQLRGENHFAEAIRRALEER